MLALLLLAGHSFDGTGHVVVHAAGDVPIEFALSTAEDYGGHGACVPLIALTAAHEQTLADAAEYEVRTRIKGRLVLIKFRWYAMVDVITFEEEKKE